MEILNPPKSYIDYRCYVHGLSGSELSPAQEKFYRKNPEFKSEICIFFNWMIEQRNNFSLPNERIEIREADGKKHGNVMTMMICDVEYWIEGGRIKQRKVYIPMQTQISKEIDFKNRAAGDYPKEWDEVIDAQQPQ